MEHKGVLLSSLCNHMNQLETTNILSLFQRDSQHIRSLQQLLHGLCTHADSMHYSATLQCFAPYLVCHVLYLHILSFRVNVDDLHTASGRGGDVCFLHSVRLCLLRPWAYGGRGATSSSRSLTEFDAQPKQKGCREGEEENSFESTLNHTAPQSRLLNRSIICDPNQKRTSTNLSSSASSS